MKKLIALLLALTMMACLFVGCGDAASDTSDDTAAPDAADTADDAAADSETGEDETAEVTDSETIIEKGTMIVGITDFAPMDYRDDNDEWTGFDAELARMVADELGVECEFIEIDWDNKILELESGAIDCVWNGMTLTDEVLNAMECSDPYVVNAQVVVMKADKIAEYPDVASMVDLAIAVEAGSAGDSTAQANGFTNVTQVAAQSDALMEVASGSADACIIDLTMAKAMTGEGTSYADLAVAVEMDREEYGIGFRKGSDMAEKVNEILSALKEDGSMQELADKYSLVLVD